MIRARLRVRGVVQGVGYRWSTVRTAQPLGLLGWVRNLPDGSVEILAEGEADAVAALERWAQDGPAHARVSGVERSDEALDGEPLEPFAVRR